MSIDPPGWAGETLNGKKESLYIGLYTQFETGTGQRDRNYMMKRKKEDYQALSQMLRDFNIDEIKAARIIRSSLGAGRPRSAFKPIIYRDIHDLMNRRKLKKKSAIRNYLKGTRFKFLQEMFNFKGKTISRIEQICTEVEKNPKLLQGLGSLKIDEKNA